MIGVSGGPDSLCLLDIMWRIGYPLLVAHLNHGLRDEADQDALAVQEAAQVRRLPFILEEADVDAFAHNHALSIEEAARKVAQIEKKLDGAAKKQQTGKKATKKK